MKMSRGYSDRMVKYIHIFFRDELKFNGRVIQMINDSSNGFDFTEHLFVTSYEDIYEVLRKEYKNIELAPSKVNLLNYYSNKCKWIIAHSFVDATTVLTACDSALSKTIYRYWGGQISGYQLKAGHFLENIIKRALNCMYRRKISKLACIGIANTVDVIDIRKTFKEVPLMVLPYTMNGLFDSLKEIKEKEQKRGSDINILLGHRGGSEENHIGIFKILKKYGNCLQIYVPLSYGDSEYIGKVKEYLSNYNNVHLLTDFMSYKDYGSLLNQMDIAIFDGTTSYALGNISILLYFEKKIFLNEHGVIREAFDYEHMPYALISDIDGMSFDEFISPVSYKSMRSDSLMTHDMDYSLTKWRELISKYQ